MTSYKPRRLLPARQSTAERSHPTSKVRGRSREDPMPEGLRPRGVTPRPRSGAAAESTRQRRRRNGREELPRVRGQGRRREELPHVQGQGQWPRVPGCNGTGTAEKSYPSPRSGAAAERSYPGSKVRCSGREELPYPRGQGRRPGGLTPRPRPGAVAGRTNPTFKEPWLRGRRRA